MLQAGMLTRAILFLLSITIRTGTGTVFRTSDHDPWNPHDRLACLHRRLDERRDACVALPAHVARCGAPVVVVNPRTFRAAWTSVCDRGPRRALVDMTRLLARRVGVNGKERVVLVLFERVGWELAAFESRGGGDPPVELRVGERARWWRRTAPHARLEHEPDGAPHLFVGGDPRPHDRREVTTAHTVVAEEPAPQAP